MAWLLVHDQRGVNTEQKPTAHHCRKAVPIQGSTCENKTNEITHQTHAQQGCLRRKLKAPVYNDLELGSCSAAAAQGVQLTLA